MGMREVQSTYTVSIEYDKRLYRQDIAGSIAHARMLARQEIIAAGEAGGHRGTAWRRSRGR